MKTKKSPERTSKKAVRISDARYAKLVKAVQVLRRPATWIVAELLDAKFAELKL